MTYHTAHPSKFVSDHIRKAQTGIHTWLWRAYFYFLEGLVEVNLSHSCFVTI